MSDYSILNNCYELDFFDQPLVDNFVFPVLEDTNFKKQNWYLWHYIEDENFVLINPKIAEWAQQNKLKINNCHLFCGPPRMKSIIHRDGPPNTNQIGINWVLSGFDSYMIWYKINENLLNKESKRNFSNMEYQQWDDNEVTEIERCQMSRPTLINAAVPHRIENNSSEHRWVFSLRFQTSTFDSWPDTVEFFKSYFVKK